MGFETDQLRSVCEARSVPRARCSPSVVEQLHARLADIRAATCAADLIVARAQIDARPPGRVRFLLDEDYELVCVGSLSRPYLNPNGHVDLERMRRVKVVKFGKSRRV